MTGFTGTQRGEAREAQPSFPNQHASAISRIQRRAADRRRGVILMVTHKTLKTNLTTGASLRSPERSRAPPPQRAIIYGADDDDSATTVAGNSNDDDDITTSPNPEEAR